MSSNDVKRCGWPKSDLSIAYHDKEWGTPQHDDQILFEYLVLDGAQAGLSWETILRKRENYRKAFDGFDPVKVARYDAKKIAKLLADPGIVRNRLKVAGAVKNAKAFLIVQKEFCTFDKYIWQFVNHEPINPRRKSTKEIPPTSPQSDAMSKDMKKRGFTFVGTTICYAMMQAAGMVNDHIVDCFRHKELCGGAKVRPLKRRKAK